ncbi:MAG: methyl-accepting chemotaxis protein [Hyphomicrobiales bacterium]
MKFRIGTKLSISTSITDVNRGAAETGSASAQVLASAQSLSAESHHLWSEADKFLSTVRAASVSTCSA